jgi:thioredoxin reductase
LAQAAFRDLSLESKLLETESSGMQRALIVGGGIAGPALGVALRRAGLDSVVYESSPVPRDDAGAFLNLAPNQPD